MRDEVSGSLSEVVKNVRKKVEERFSKPTKEQRLEEEARRVAYENVAAFVSADVQTTKAEFKSGNNTNVIDLDKEKTGTIFRITWETKGSKIQVPDGETHQVYSWLVLGRDRENKTSVYEVYQKSTDKVPQQGGGLKLPMEDVDIYKLKRQVKEFSVDETLKVFFGMSGEVGRVVKLDRMWGGTPESKRNPDRKSTPVPTGTLVPIPQGVEI